MRLAAAAIALLASAAAAQAVSPVPYPIGTYSNEEQVYFETEAGRTPPPAVFVVIGQDRSIRQVDAYGAPVATPGAKVSVVNATVVASFADGRRADLRPARSVTCWASLRKEAKKPDGSEDWTFAKDIKLHDQGGRALVGQGETGIKPVILRMRNVTWAGSARSTNRPSLVLYVHTPDEPDKAVSYVWSDPGAARLGVNLRWMQASCTVDGMESKG